MKTAVLCSILALSAFGNTPLASDNFNRADESPLAGPNWTTPIWGLYLHNNAVTGYPGGRHLACIVQTQCLDMWTAMVWPNDQYSQANISTSSTVGGGQGIGLFVRGNATAYAGYRLVVDAAASNNMQLVRVDNVSGHYSITVLWTRTVVFTSGDLIRLEVQGSTLRAFDNGVQVGADFTDSTFASGYPGIAYAQIDNGATSLDNWEGGSLN